MQSGDRLCKSATHYAVKRPAMRICDPLCSLVTGYANLWPTMQSGDRLCKSATRYAVKRPVLRICNSLCSLVTGYANLRPVMQPSDPFCESATHYAVKCPTIKLSFRPKLYHPTEVGSSILILFIQITFHTKRFSIQSSFWRKNIVFLLIFIKLR